MTTAIPQSQINRVFDHACWIAREVSKKNIKAAHVRAKLLKAEAARIEVRLNALLKEEKEKEGVNDNVA